MVDIYYDQLEDWYETEEEPKPKKARRGRPSKNYNLSEQNSDEEWKDVKNVKRKIKGRPKKSENFFLNLMYFHIIVCKNINLCIQVILLRSIAQFCTQIYMNCLQPSHNY